MEALIFMNTNYQMATRTMREEKMSLPVWEIEPDECRDFGQWNSISETAHGIPKLSKTVNRIYSWNLAGIQPGVKTSIHTE